jgi:hypothetical protein
MVEVEILIQPDGTILLPAEFLRSQKFMSFLLSESKEPEAIHIFKEYSNSELIFGNNIFCG